MTDGRAVVLALDPDLAAHVAGAQRARAERLSVAMTLRREAGRWQAGEDARHGRDGAGLLVLEGMLVRRVGLQGRFGAELLSVGDLLQPWEHDGQDATVPFESSWRVLTPLRLAVLDLAWMTRMAPFPQIAAELARRLMARSRRLATMLAIAHHHRLEDRLRLFFWELADRYGRVTPDGVRLELGLTHELIGHLVGAYRPSVSVALARLERDGHLLRGEHGVLLLGAAPRLDEAVSPRRDPRPG